MALITSLLGRFTPPPVEMPAVLVPQADASQPFCVEQCMRHGDQQLAFAASPKCSRLNTQLQQAGQLAGGAAGHALEWVQRPPCGAAVWLHAKLTKSGGIAGSTAAHIFSPAPAVKLTGGGESGVEAAAAALSTATVRLYDSGMVEVPHLLHSGPPVLDQDAHGTQLPVLRWPEMAVLDVCRPVDGVADNLTAAELQVRAHSNPAAPPPVLQGIAAKCSTDRALTHLVGAGCSQAAARTAGSTWQSRSRGSRCSG